MGSFIAKKYDSEEAGKLDEIKLLSDLDLGEEEIEEECPIIEGRYFTTIPNFDIRNLAVGRPELKWKCEEEDVKLFT